MKIEAVWYWFGNDLKQGIIQGLISQSKIETLAISMHEGHFDPEKSMTFRLFATICWFHGPSIISAASNVVF